ncbi:MAG TPA: VOC family protein [Galbitalea sp.]|jgi:predicted enzyme related to lactoylglutathione lyase|nr:VOC family protein [Galbitalea sp.]
MAISHVQVISVPVTDQDRARDFYVEALGCELAADFQMSPDMRWVMVKPPEAQTALTLVTWFPTMPAGSLRGLVLETTDLESDVERLTGLGVTIENGIEDAPWGRYAQFSDPDGNGLILQATYANA